MIGNSLGSDHQLCDNQSIPEMTSRPFDSKTIRLVIKATPLILRFTFGHCYHVGISPPGELSII
jgi:hypothetical protein